MLKVTGLGYCALQLRDTRVLLRNVHYPFEGPSERAILEQELECVGIVRRFIDLGDFNTQPAWRTGDHVLMPNLKTWRKNAGSPTFVSCIGGARFFQTVSVDWRQSRQWSLCRVCNTVP